MNDLEPSEDYLQLMYRDVPFTGIAYEENDAGILVSEMRYREGKKEGLAREWSENGTLLKEQSFIFDALHGRSREWYGNGIPKIDAEYELGICLRATEWTIDGSVFRELQISEESPQFGTLRRLRASSLGQAILRKGRANPV
jgi:antitoxin component YwqK of YwqJK toxin-antitoxin module